jgi:hypothetical protein
MVLLRAVLVTGPVPRTQLTGRTSGVAEVLPKIVVQSNEFFFKQD